MTANKLLRRIHIDLRINLVCLFSLRLSVHVEIR